MMKRLVSFASIGLLAACVSARGGREPSVRVRVVNAARYTMQVRTCSPGPCSQLRPVRPGAKTTFTFAWTGYPRYFVEGRDGDRVAIQVPVEFNGPGRQTVTLVPPPHPQESTR
ncbi:hypothetical protein SAMN05216486_10721 [bacterium JGI 053]|nr:hypothetical protein SAMN05216486_10721 [bacterium JGI 053]